MYQDETDLKAGEKITFDLTPDKNSTLGPIYKDVTNIDLALQLCPLADDIWLNTMVRLNGNKIIKISSINVFLPVLNKNKTTLYSVNLLDGHNDIQLKQVISYYQKKLNVDPYKFMN